MTSRTNCTAKAFDASMSFIEQLKYVGYMLWIVIDNCSLIAGH